MFPWAFGEASDMPVCSHVASLLSHLESRPHGCAGTLFSTGH